jgi:glycosyltransferase involved in cell wall biosynthesis
MNSGGWLRWMPGLVGRAARRLGRVLVPEMPAVLTGIADAGAELVLLRARCAELERRCGEAEQRAAELERRLAESAAEVRDHIAASAGELDRRLGELDRRLAESAAEAERLRTASHAGLAARVEELLRRQSAAERWLTEWMGSAPAAPAPADGPLVSVILPTWNRADRLPGAVASVLAQTYPRWELLILDDGSDDDTRAALAPFLGDPRVRYEPGPHVGAAAARNRGLALSRGEVVAYLDSDNRWAPGHLAAVVRTFADRPDCDSLYAAQAVRSGGEVFVRYEPFDRARLEQGNFIDLSAFAHRRSLYERLGGFDERLTRLMDWDLILRYTADRPPAAAPHLCGTYESGPWPRITTREPHWRNHHLIRRKLLRPVPRPVRVLYAVWHYPQLSESYVRWEIAAMRRRGVEIEVWSERTDLGSPFAPDVPVHHGPLEEAVRRVRPDVLHVHWMSSATRFVGIAGTLGVPLTVRAHGFELTPELIAAMEAATAVEALYLFPHAPATGRSGKVRRLTSCFNPDLYHPVSDFDPRLVVRTGGCLPTKQLEWFFETAARCPNHRFVAAVVRCLDAEPHVERVLEANRRLGGPAEVLVNVPTEELAATVRRAGIHLHTHGTERPFGMPVSVSETMACGAWQLLRDLPGAAEYIGEAGRLYRDVDEAVAFVRETESWTPERWAEVRRTSVERAYERFADDRVLEPILHDWQRLADRRRG